MREVVLLWGSKVLPMIHWAVGSPHDAPTDLGTEAGVRKTRNRKDLQKPTPFRREVWISS